MPDPLMEAEVHRAVGQLRLHPHWDALDAAFAVVVNPHRHPLKANIGCSRWPEFLAAVKEASQKPADSA